MKDRDEIVPTGKVLWQRGEEKRRKQQSEKCNDLVRKFKFMRCGNRSKHAQHL